MKIDLNRVDSQDVGLDLPTTGGSERHQAVRLQAVEALSGRLQQDADTLRLSNANAERILLDALALWFGTVLVQLEGDGSLDQVKVEFERTRGDVTLDLGVEALRTSGLRIAVGTVDVGAVTRLSNALLRVRPGGGSIEAVSVDLEAFQLTLFGSDFSAETLAARRLRVGWGKGGFELDVREVRAPALKITARGTTVLCREIAATSLVIRDGDLSIEGLNVGNVVVDLDLVAAPVEPEAGVERTAKSEKSPPLFDWTLLDGLSGHVRVDAKVDAKVPLIGRRRATHKLRLRIEEGRLNFRELEDDLSKLEDALLDFSVRDDALVLELGIPLLPTRGLGKPLVRWSLSPEDIELAQRDQVRLAVLPLAQTPKTDSTPPGESGEGRRRGGIELAKLLLENIEIDLALGERLEPMETVVRSLSWAGLRAGGFLGHARDGKDDPPHGKVKAQGEALEVSLAGLSVGSKEVDLSEACLGRIVTFDTRFLGLRPCAVHVEADALKIARIRHHGG